MAPARLPRPGLEPGPFPSKAALSLDSVIEAAARFLASGDTRPFSRWLASRPWIRDLSPRDTYYLCLNRLPESLRVMSRAYANAEEAANHVVASLTSQEFRARAPEIVASGRPDVPRLFFIHIPRTAGTSIRLRLEAQFRLVSWNDSLAQDGWDRFPEVAVHGGGERFILAFLAQFARPDPCLFYASHTPIEHLLAKGLIRPGDLCFSILRDPVEIITSGINYILYRAMSAGDRPDGAWWRARLEEIAPDWRARVRTDPALLDQVVRSAWFTHDYSNVILRHLSLDGTPEGALEAIGIAQVQLAWADQASAFVHQTFGGPPELERANAFPPVIAPDRHLAPGTRAFIREALCAQDYVFLQALSRAPQGSAPLPPSRG